MLPAPRLFVGFNPPTRHRIFTINGPSHLGHRQWRIEGTIRSHITFFMVPSISPLAYIDVNSLSFRTYTNRDVPRLTRTVVIYFVRLGLLRTVGVYSHRTDPTTIRSIYWGNNPRVGATHASPYGLRAGFIGGVNKRGSLRPCILRLRKT